MEKRTERDLESLFTKNDAPKKPLLTLIRMYKDDWKSVLLSVILFIVQSSPTWIIPLITEQIINTAAYKADDAIKKLIVFFMLGAVIIGQNAFSTHGRAYVEAKFIRRAELTLRASLVTKLQHLSISFHKQLKTGKIQSKILRDVDNITMLSQSVISLFENAVINMTIYAAITLVKSPIVALFFILTVPLASIILVSFRKTVRTQTSSLREEVEKMSANVSEMIEMIPVTRAHGLEKLEIDKLTEKLESVKMKAIKTDSTYALFAASSWVAFQLAQLICLCCTGYLALIGKISVGEIALYQSYFASLLGCMSNLLSSYPNIAKGLDSLSSVSEILSSTDVENDAGKPPVKNFKGNFKFENVSFAYADQPDFNIISDFTLDIKKGERVAFVGESGSGKSTILNMLIGFNFPSQGKLLVDGIDITKLSLNSYRKHIAVVSQTNILFSGSIKENIIYGMPNATDEEIKRVVKLSNLESVLEGLPFGIQTNVGEHGGKLSGGQKQRVAIARALIRNPDVILLDEATSALDNVSEFEVQKAMDELMRGRTTFIVAHRLSTIRNANKIVVLKQGRIVEMGSYDELMAMKGEFYTLEKLQHFEAEKA